MTECPQLCDSFLHVSAAMSQRRVASGESLVAMSLY
jgi:hypothetical protein